MIFPDSLLTMPRIFPLIDANLELPVNSKFIQVLFIFYSFLLFFCQCTADRQHDGKTDANAFHHAPQTAQYRVKD